jgi:hypothetical protein
MERSDEEGQAQESSRGGAGQIRGAGTERSQKARQQGERPQGRFGQKPQEDRGSTAQCAAATPWAAQEAVNLLIKFICAVTASRQLAGAMAVFAIGPLAISA